MKKAQKCHKMCNLPLPRTSTKGKKKAEKKFEEECGNILTVEFPTEIGCDALEKERFERVCWVRWGMPRRKYHNRSWKNSSKWCFRYWKRSLIYCYTLWTMSFRKKLADILYHWDSSSHFSLLHEKVFKRTEVASEKAFSVMYGLCQPQVFTTSEKAFIIFLKL